MTVSTQTAKSQYTGNGVTVAFTGSFPILDEDHALVILTSALGVDTTQTISTHYTISGVGGSTFTVTFLTAPASGVKVTIARNVPLTQELDLVENSQLPSSEIEKSYDKSVMIDQQINEKISRSLQFPVTDASSLSAELPNATVRASKLLSFDSNGEPTVTEVTDIGDLQLPVSIADGGTGATNAAAAFDALKQTATDTATGVVELATQAEVTAGTDATRAVTPETLAGRDPALVTIDTGADEIFIRDATDGKEKLVAASAFGTTAASQADMETATSTSVFSSPGRQQHHPAHPKAVVNFNGTGTIAIRWDYGVSSLTDHGGSGEYSVNFDVAFSSANYVAIGICDRTINTTHSTEGIQTVTFGTGAFRFICANSIPTATDQEYIGMAFWGDQ